jgi:hypothetical protein
VTEPLCRLCLYWKRRSHTYGTCWQRTEFFPGPKSQTHENDACEDYSPHSVDGPNMQRSENLLSSRYDVASEADETS